MLPASARRILAAGRTAGRPGGRLRSQLARAAPGQGLPGLRDCDGGVPGPDGRRLPPLATGLGRLDQVFWLETAATAAFGAAGWSKAQAILRDKQPLPGVANHSAAAPVICRG